MNDDKDRFLLDRRYTAAFDNLDDSALGTLALALEGDLRDGFAQIVGLPADAYENPASLGVEVRNGIAKRRVAHDAGVVLAEPCTQWTIDKLGESSEDPTLEELHAVLPEAITEYGLDALSLRDIIRWCRGTVRVQVIDLLWLNTGRLKSVSHTRHRALATLTWSCHVIRVA